MTEAIQTTPAPSEARSLIPVTQNPAIAKCSRAWNNAYQKEIANGTYEGSAARIAGQVYRRLMPPLTGQENIRDFIACVAYGLLIGAIDQNCGSKLLYAAQVAHTTLRGQSATPKTVAELYGRAQP
jgi:hypothetical protein